ncbi:MAG TPA: ribosome maturation factor RimP [Syntrophales bacterium]|nr:ribosome maturation factor RimP [Syntrophales bacterium]HRT62503.1 ribosome maturation factor RimP [Syntrophales bacterium]
MANRYREKIIERVEPVIDAEGMELVDVECLRMKTRWLVRIYIDKEGGVTIDDCTDISRQVGDLLDVYDIPPGPYTLEVSSPGLDRPLALDKDFIRFRGSKIKVRLTDKIEGSRNFRGTLEGFLEEGGEKIVVIAVDGKQYRIPRKLVAKAQLEYEL